MDVNNAFLHGHLEEDVYMTPPEGYSDAVSGLVCKLNRSLYGLKQASRQWNMELTSQLQRFGFVQAPSDHYLFLKRTDNTLTALLVYVDNIVLTGDSIQELDAVKAYFNGLFTIKDLGSAKYFLGLELARSSHGILVTQQKYITDILTDAHLLDAKVVTTPLPPGLHLKSDSGALLSDPGCHRWLAGRLLYLGFTWPNISFAAQQHSQFLQHPHESHWQAAMHVLRYLKVHQPVPFFCGNKAALHITANPVFHERTKHLDIDSYVVQDQFKRGFIAPSHIPRANMWPTSSLSLRL
ncbi:UNVERIFIED_CONTAM: Retrovirus-related Pol polyprotein from transposon RE1 [Sesamum calycinum]|uniref:Retrovirus-related Pol polyprotein from transposon RE1 n=1 Tax=Sesamum calycinum TaxID=2727403 RepID=A0AAW2R091_9LAMI